MTRSNVSAFAKRASTAATIALLALGAGSTTGCSDAPSNQPVTTAPPAPQRVAAASTPVSTPAPKPMTTLASAPKPSATASRVLGKQDIKLAGGKPVCEVRFVYAGSEPENVFWDEPCASVTAIMIGRRELEAQNDWEALDSFDREFVEAMPGGRVLYVSGAFSASIYPLGTTGVSHEVAVSD